MVREVSNNEDILDSRDIIARIEELEDERDSYVIGAPDGTETPFPEGWAQEYPEEAEELKTLKAFAEEMEGYCADWAYGETLIRDSYFKEYAMQLADDIGAIDGDARWPNDCIDWEQAARELQMDYVAVEWGEVTYWARS